MTFKLQSLKGNLNSKNVLAKLSEKESIDTLKVINKT